jgi:alpha-L-fucosidase
MKISVLLLSTLMLASSLPGAQSVNPAAPENSTSEAPVSGTRAPIADPAKAEKLPNASPAANETAGRELETRWFREARFGLFIHWGVYSVPAGEWKGKKHSTYGEWLMRHAKIPIAEYKELAREFTASKYDPKAWADLAKEAGMKYVVITSKHHDGFALFDSEASDWNAVKASAAKRDLIAPLAEAVRANGLRFGLYYSQAQDWVSGGSVLGSEEGEGIWDPAQKTNFDDYLKNVSLPQVREILERYQPDILWWDTPAWMNKERARPFAELLKEKAPNMISNNRLGAGFQGDTATPEQYIPARGMPGKMFEVCMTMNDTWGYKSFDHRWKSVGLLLRQLSDISSKGGNFLLNVGPTKEGEIPQPSIDRLKAMGRWMADYGEAIYGTEASPYVRQLPWGRITKKVDDKGGATLYLHVWEWPSDGRILLPGLSNQPISGRLLKGGAPLQSEPTAEGLVVTLPGQPTHEDISVAALVFKEPLTISGNSLPLADPQKPLTLSASEADCVGFEEANLRMEGQGEEAYWTDWNDPRFRLEYSVESKKAGKWKVSAEVAGEQPAKLLLTINNGKPPNPETEVAPAGKLAWKTFDLGIIDLPAGVGSFQIRAVKEGWKPVDLRRVTLTPVQ